MNVRDIVRKAWQITQVHLKKLIWYGFVPSFFGVIVSSTYLTYQYSAFRRTTESSADYIQSLRNIWELITTHQAISVIGVVLAALILLGYFILTPMFKGAMIQAVMRIKNYEKIDGSFEIGVRHFFPLFEFGLLTGAFSINTLFTESSFIYRWWGADVLFAALPVLLFIAMAGLIINFLLTYCEYYIVLESKGIMKSLMESAVLVISNLRKTFLVFILMLLIGARIILNVLLVLLIPMLVVFLTTYMATIFNSTFGLVMIGIFSLLVLIVSSYLLGLFQVFSTAVWVLTFAELNPRVAQVQHEGDAKAENTEENSMSS